MQVNKSLLKKFLGLLTVAVLAVTMAFGLVGCGDATVKDVSKEGGKIVVTMTDDTTKDFDVNSVVGISAENGKLVIKFTDGKTSDVSLGNAQLSTSINAEGETVFALTFADGTSSVVALPKTVADVKTLEDGSFEFTYTDGSKKVLGTNSVVSVEELENGQTKITYADGTEVVTGDAACNHRFTASAEIKPASCCEKGVAIQVCEDCGYVESIEVEKNPDVHGEWTLYWEVQYGELEYDVDEDEGIIYYSREDEGYSMYRLVTQYDCDSVTILEGYSGVADLCFKAECLLCGEQFAAGHAPVDQWENIVLDDDLVNICENEHTVYKTCPICHSVLLYDEDGVIVTEKEPALGHIYGEPVIGNKVATVSPAYYPVTLTCTRCGEGQTVRAYFKDDVNVPANCGANGYYYAIYEYSYINYVDGVAKTIEGNTFECEHEVFENTGAHTLAEGLMFNAYDNIELLPNYEYSPAIKPYFDDETIRWNNGEPASCSVYKLAGFTCTVCNQLIVVSLSGEHTLGEEHEVVKNCTEDGYKYRTCIVCNNYEYQYDFDYATGHNYRYVNNSFNEEYMTARFICSICGDEIEVEVEWDGRVDATNCGETSYDKYVAEVPVIGNETATRTIKINDEEELPLHTIAAGVRRYAAYDNNAQVPNYEFNDQLKALFENETIRWNNGEPADCEHYKLAGFTCTVCNKLIVISISGEHIHLDQNDVLDVAPGCETRGYTAIKCMDCDQYIEQTATDAVGHRFVPNADSWDEFLAADVKAGKAVVFDCADCDESITLYAKQTVTNSSDGCVTTDTYRYDFYTAANNTTNYTYQVETAEESTKILTFKYFYSFAVDQGTHLVGTYNNIEERVVAYNMDAPDANRYEFGDQYKYFIENGIVRWNAGIPGTCEDGYALAGFDCEVCGKLIIFLLSGEHTLGEEFTVEPDCTTDGYKYKVCSVCDTQIITAELPALGHDYGEWTIMGDLFAVAIEQGGDVYIENYYFGYAISVCARCQDELDAYYDVISITYPTCGKDGKVVVGYYFDDELVATTTVIIPMIDHHITTLDTAEHVIKWFDEGKYFLGYVCEDCGNLVVVAKSANEEVIDGIVEELTADYVNELLGRA